MKLIPAKIPFTREAILKHIPPKLTGAYKIFQDETYSLYRGMSNVLKIGMSQTSLQQELLNHLDRHTCRNRLDRIRAQDGIKLYVSLLLDFEQNPRDMETQLLKEFEDLHWDIPVLNSQRGYGRNEDAHYRINANAGWSNILYN